MRVFRVEHTTNKHDESNHFVGPFQSTCNASDGIYAYDSGVYDPYYNDSDYADPRDHPTPAADSIYDWDHTFVCAVASLDAIQDWFPDIKGRIGMKDAGYIVREYKANVREAHKGLMQVMVKAKNLKLQTEFDLETLVPVS